MKTTTCNYNENRIAARKNFTKKKQQKEKRKTKKSNEKRE